LINFSHPNGKHQFIDVYCILVTLNRNPVPSQRLPPTEISRTLQKSDRTLLPSRTTLKHRCSTEELSTELGAPLESSRNLFTDLQKTYLWIVWFMIIIMMCGVCRVYWSCAGQHACNHNAIYKSMHIVRIFEINKCAFRNSWKDWIYLCLINTEYWHCAIASFLLQSTLAYIQKKVYFYIIVRSDNRAVICN